MIHDLADLEPLLRQYHPEKVLVGPLLNLWTNSSFRVFKIAGNGGKIYETVGLGFVKVEADAQRRRADIVAVLESRFGEVQTFDSQLEMAQAAHTLWANDETARFLATATAESRLRPTAKVDQDQSLDDASKSSVLPSDRDRELVDEAARGSVALDAMSAHAQPSARDQAQATLDLPIHANLPLDRDSFTFAAVGLESSTETRVLKRLVRRLILLAQDQQEACHVSDRCRQAILRISGTYHRRETALLEFIKR